ncbi:MAG TPA: hypothetical protein VHH33_08635 [Nitrososphaeraceae archaeon]|jgi:hypothetical protein|nr:hypothetical protein [Nitrososphaeraceae archaeon]
MPEKNIISYYEIVQETIDKYSQHSQLNLKEFILDLTTYTVLSKAPERKLDECQYSIN